jgi:antitoxin HicB
VSLTYSVVVLREKGGEFSVVVPALEGCATYGETLPDALRNAEEAILAYIDGLHALGKPVPADVPSVTVDLGDATEASVYKLTLIDEAKVA